MKNKLVAVLLPFLLLCAAALPAAGAVAPESIGGPGFSKVDAALDQAVQERRLVGAVLMAARDGKTVYARAVGFADRENATPMRLDTVFRLASTSKAFTAMAAAALISRGKLALDDPVSKVLPYFTPPLPDGGKAEIRIVHLLSHTAGLDYGFFQGADGPYRRAGVSDGLDLTPLTLEENLKRLASVPLLFTPGAQWRYSLATDVLGGVVAAVHGASLDVAVRELVCEPLGLESTAFFVSRDAVMPAKPYYNALPEPLPMRPLDQEVRMGVFSLHFSPDRAFHPEAFPSGGAGMLSTAADVLRLLEAIRNDGAPVAAPDVLREMKKPFTAPNAIAPGSAHALGWSVITDRARLFTPQANGTLGWGGVYGSMWFVDPQNKLSVVLLTNTTFEGTIGKAVLDVRNALYDVPVKPCRYPR
ncbi:MAG: beta-lactamase family protein [Desulfovibrio sp.]|jgi:CubicO group peptidase (beta-lactamase class C family)|nr:beta-lactamase family protein [Desulfovibrio sp.]